MSEKLIEQELLWRRYNLLSDLYKFYLELLVNSNLLIYGITGGIVTYTFSNASPIIRWSLALPFLLCVTTAFISLRGVRQAKDLQQEILYIRDRMDIGLAPHVDVLIFALFASGFMFVLVSVALLVIFFLV